nr:hypothetical protein [Tanacetum cinerariifolium]
MIEMPITSAKEKAHRRLEVKARSTLMMGIPNEHQLMFNSIKDAKKLLEVVEKRFGRNAAIKKTQRKLLKQQYENFTTSSLEMLDQTFDWLQKLVSQLKLLGENLLQEDVNQKLLRSLSHEWNTHAVVWRNKANLDTMSMDDLYNNLKVQPNSPQLVHENLEQIHPDDIEEVHLRWQMAMLTMRGRKFFKKIGRKLTVNGNETIGFDKSKVECYNYHKSGHYARECRALRNQDNKHKESTRRSVFVETSASTALVSCDGLGRYDWRDDTIKATKAFSSIVMSDMFFRKIFLLKYMDQDYAHMVAVSKVSLLKPENDATLPKTQVVEGVMIEMPITSAKEKAHRRLEVKARSTLMMGIPNEHQLMFNSIKDAKKLLEVVEKRFGRNAAIKKTQRKLLKQQYENITASSSEMLD